MTEAPAEAPAGTTGPAAARPGGGPPQFRTQSDDRSRDPWAAGVRGRGPGPDPGTIVRSGSWSYSRTAPARSAVEGGRVLPEPGQEKEWLARRGEA
ncbi:hypothetical protein [Streptomyces sp. NPDC008092]|uniref:hypothetical protein n=1 Tax=Streptomyces sp. NPDC008092 TaxID=3364808 RepID=UPI0036EE005A